MEFFDGSDPYRPQPLRANGHTLAEKSKRPDFSQWTRLDDYSTAVLADLAHRRNASKKHVRESKHAPSRKSGQLHFLGVAAEFIVAQVLGVAMDDTIRPEGSDKIGNLTYKDKQIMVVCRQMDCYVDEGTMYADAIVMVAYRERGEFNERPYFEFRLVGWLDKKQFDAKKMKRDFGHGPRDFVSGADLNPIAGLCQSRPEQINPEPVILPVQHSLFEDN